MRSVRETFCCLSVLLFGATLVSRVGLAFEQDSMTLEEKRSALVDEMAAFLEPSLGKELVAQGRTAEYVLVPANFGVGQKVQKRNSSGSVKRSVKYSVRIGENGMGWERFSLKKRNGEVWKQEIGCDGETAISLHWQGKTQRAIINCGTAGRSIRMSPEFVAGLKLLYSTGTVDLTGDGSTPLLMFLIRNSEDILTGETVEGLGKVTVVQSGMTKCYLRRDPVTHCVGFDKIGSKSDIKFRIQFKSSGTSVVPFRCERTAFIKNGNGSRSVAAYAEAKFEDIKFNDLPSTASYLPNIPSGMEVKNNCNSKQAVSSSAGYSWLWVVPIAALVVLGRKLLKKRNS